MTTAVYLGELTGNLRSCACLHKVRRKRKYNMTLVGRYVMRNRARLAAALRALFDEWSKRVARKVVARYRDQHEKLLKAKTKDPAQQLMDDVLDAIDFEGMSQDVADELYPAMHKAFKRAGVKSAQDVLGHAPKDLVQQLDEKARAYAKKRAAELIGKTGGEWSITETMRVSLKSKIVRAVEEGWDPDKLASEIEDAHPFSPGRADTIARTELAFAHVQGNVQGWKETGLVDKKRSILGDLHDIDDECDQNADSDPVAIDEPFPSGDMFPPYHPNCVCDVVPVMKEDE